MQLSRLAVCAIALLVGTPSLGGSESEVRRSISESEREDAQEEQNFGQDPTRPLWRIDLRQAVSVESDMNSYITLVRTDAPVLLREGRAGILALRLDVPVLAVADVDGLGTQSGYGDLLFGAIYIPPFPWAEERFGLDGIGLGAEFELPTSNVDAISGNRWLIAGVFAFKLDMPRVSDDSFFVPQFKYRFKVADHEGGAEELRQLEAQPEFYFETRSFGWWLDFVSLWDTQEIEINLVDDGKRSAGDVFAPIEVTMGKMFGRNLVTALSVAVPIYSSDSLDTYDWFVEVRAGLLF